MAAGVKKTITKIPVGGITQPGVKELMLCREATFRFGYIHEIQALQMKIWPSVFLSPEARVAELRYLHEDREMVIELRAIEKGKLNLTDGALRLDRAVKFLLGPDVRVKVVAAAGAGGLLYDGEPRDEKWLSNTPAPKQKKRPVKNAGKRKR